MGSSVLVSLMYRRAPEASECAPFSKLIRTPDHTGGVVTSSANLVVKDADEVYARVKKAGVKIVSEIEDKSYEGISGTWERTIPGRQSSRGPFAALLDERRGFSQAEPIWSRFASAPGACQSGGGKSGGALIRGLARRSRYNLRCSAHSGA